MISKKITGLDPTIAPPKVLASPTTLGKPKTLPKPVVFSGASPKSPEEHMAKRQKAGLSQRAIASDFNTSKSTVGRTLKKGYTKID
jgi:hypothetical protein